MPKKKPELIIAGGPMFAGKTTWLLEYASHLPHGSFELFKPRSDTRYSESHIVTHDGRRMPAQNLDGSDPIFPEMESSVETVLLDELNFFLFAHLLPQIELQQEQGRSVVGVGLLYDYKRQPFGATLPLSERADSFTEIFAKCDGCGGPARNTYRKIQVEGQFVLGAEETYGACCDACWSKFSTQA